MSERTVIELEPSVNQDDDLINPDDEDLTTQQRNIYDCEAQKKTEGQDSNIAPKFRSDEWKSWEREIKDKEQDGSISLIPGQKYTETEARDFDLRGLLHAYPIAAFDFWRFLHAFQRADSSILDDGRSSKRKKELVAEAVNAPFRYIQSEAKQKEWREYLIKFREQIIHENISQEALAARLYGIIVAVEGLESTLEALRFSFERNLPKEYPVHWMLETARTAVDDRCRLIEDSLRIDKPKMPSPQKTDYDYQVLGSETKRHTHRSQSRRRTPGSRRGSIDSSRPSRVAKRRQLYNAT